jgi:hypothetical protein
MSAARPPAGDQQEVCTCETGEGLQQCKQITRSGSRKASVERSTQRQLQNGGLPEVCVPRTARQFILTHAVQGVCFHRAHLLAFLLLGRLPPICRMTRSVLLLRSRGNKNGDANPHRPGNLFNLKRCSLLHRVLYPLLVELIWNLSRTTRCEFHLRVHDVSPNKCKAQSCRSGLT